MAEQADFELDPPKPAPKRKPAAKAGSKAAAKPAAKAKPKPKPKAVAKPGPNEAAETPTPPKEEPKAAPKNDGDPSANVIGGNAKAVLKSFRDRIENLEAEKAEIADEIREVYAEAKSHGFDTAILRKVIAAGKKDQDKRAEQAALFELYADALGVETYAAMEA